MSGKLINIPGLILLTTFLAISLCIYPASAPGDTFAVTDQRETSLSGKPLDLAVSSDGQWTFVLTNKGEVSIYGISGSLVQTLKVGEGYDTLEFSPAGNRLLLSGAGHQDLKILTLSLIFELDYSGSPFKGPADAPVAIAVFDDFQ